VVISEITCATFCSTCLSSVLPFVIPILCPSPHFSVLSSHTINKLGYTQAGGSVNTSSEYIS